jgi:molecular chaperone GrpE
MEEKSKKEFAECEKKKEEYLAGWQRARADFLNYKKEEMQRIGALVGMSQAEIILKLLPILDNFDIIEEKLSDDLKNNPEVKGILQIKTQIQDFLKKYGIEEIKSLGKKFDPNFHEVVEQIEIKEKESGIIIEETQKGYTLQGKIIRAAKVKVAK